MTSLYLCYFSIRENLVQTQVLPYLRELARVGHVVHLLTFERQGYFSEEAEEQRLSLKADGIRWTTAKYHKAPSLPMTIYDIVIGACRTVRYVSSNNVQIVHARSHIPLAMALFARVFLPFKVIFDLRGLMVEEYQDAGVWAEGSLVSRGVKKLEQIGLRRADHVVVLTQRLKLYLDGRYPDLKRRSSVIPCCVDQTRFSSRRAKTFAPGRFEIVYCGSTVGRYLLREMAAFFVQLRETVPEAFFKVITNSSLQQVTAELRGAGLADNEFSTISVPVPEVAAQLVGGRAGLMFLKNSFSAIASSPTKIPEYLAAGLPVLASANIGDTDSLLKDRRIGVIVPKYTREILQLAVLELLDLLKDPGTAERCRRAARECFDVVTVGGARYREVYGQLESAA